MIWPPQMTSRDFVLTAGDYSAAAPNDARKPVPWLWAIWIVILVAGVVYVLLQ